MQRHPTLCNYLIHVFYIGTVVLLHSMELYVLGDIDKFDELEGLKDPEFGDNHWQTWVDLSKLEGLDVRPKKLVKLIIEDYKSDFSGETKYLGEVD